ncbi:UDP-glycosyltransferase UGT5-like [Culicoides brevitarsis]|uniref:UDP-glycosyltransferase UGT5-like n=1 Tax=Culicoides brevitarsis TaxID=469753 RepID=UPI00307C3FBD
MKGFLYFFALISFTSAGNILFLAPFNGPSHWLFLSNIIRELLQKGHHLTAVTGIPLKGGNENYTEILIDPPYDFNRKFSPDSVFDGHFVSPFVSVLMLYELGIDNSEWGLQNEKVQKLINSKSLKFDLVISEQFFQETWLMFAHKFNAPLVTISTLGHTDYMDYANGLMTPLAYVPHVLVDFSDKMTFFERCENVALTLFDRFYRLASYMPRNNELARKYFGNLEKENGYLPSVEDMERKIDLMLVNFNNALSKPRPQMPNQINIGGAHIRKNPSPLPADMQKFLDEAEHGVIYMSLGAFVQSSLMPEEKLREILSAFSQLKQRVLWKFEAKLENIPKNVMINKWMPQADILAHKNIRLFISHGGMFGTSEGTSNGVPMLFIPFYGDQHRNAIKGEKAGTALKIRFGDITAESFLKKITTIIDNPKYRDNAKEIARVFNDNVVHPMDTAIFYIEYVMRNKGAKYLKSGAVELSWYQHFYLDILGFVCGILFILGLILYGFVKFLVKIICGGAKKSKKSSVKTKKS